jgi:hypothetical protein
VKEILRHLFGSLDRSVLQREVEEELQFHIEMQMRDYESEGLTPEEAFARAGRRFGDFAQIKSQCLLILFQRNISTRIVKLLFTISLMAGLLIRSSSAGVGEAQIGNMLIAIAILGGFLLIGKSIHATPAQESLRLDLDNGTAAEYRRHEACE